MVTRRSLPVLELADARRLALDAQLLSGRDRPSGEVTDEMVTSVVAHLGYLQRDPLAVVAPSHRLVLWSRLEADVGERVERALWNERRLFEYWAHAAAIVPAADLSLHRWRMCHYRRRPGPWGERGDQWLLVNQPLRRAILRRLAREGPLPAAAFQPRGVPVAPGGGWSSWKDHQRMLEMLWLQGRVVISGRDRRGRLWNLPQRWLPGLMAEPAISEERALKELAHRSLSALGVGSRRQIGLYLSDGAPGLAAFDRLLREGGAHEVTVVGDQGPLPGGWYISPAALESWLDGRCRSWVGRTTLLSPFDNLIIDRNRTEQLFGYRYRMEIYVPRTRRQYGYYVLPILHQDRLVGRLDCRRDQSRGELEVLSVHREAGIPDDPQTGPEILRSLHALAQGLGLSRVVFAEPGTMPGSWRAALTA